MTNEKFMLWTKAASMARKQMEADFPDDFSGKMVLIRKTAPPKKCPAGCTKEDYHNKQMGYTWYLKTKAVLCKLESEATK